ncbi:MAG: hypothetical protein ACRDJE_17800 [Dehalococcoidia bacterium]
MTQITPDQRDILQAAGWTEEEAVAFAQTLTAFRDGLPPRQRDAFATMLTTAGAAAGEQVQGYVLRPVGQPPTLAGLPPTASNQVVIAIIAILIG